MFHKRYAIEYRLRALGPGAWRRWPDNYNYDRWYLAASRDRVLLALRIMHFVTHEFRGFDSSIMADVEADFACAALVRDPTGYADRLEA